MRWARLTQLGPGSARRDLAVTLAARTLQLVLAFAGHVVCARVLGAEDFGRFGLVIAVVMIAGTLADAGLTFAVVRFVARFGDSDSNRARASAVAYFYLRAATAILFTGIGLALAELIASSILGQPELAGYIALGVLALLPLWLSSYPGAIMSGLTMFSRLSLAGVLNAIITVAGIVTLAALGALSLSTLIAWNVVLPLVSSIPAWLLLPASWRPWRLRVGRAHALNAGGELVRFGRWTGAATVGAMIGGQVDLLLMGRLADPASTGAYSVAITLAGRLDVINQSLFTIMMPRASRLSGREQFRSYTRKVLKASAVLAGGLVVIALAAQPFILLFYGVEYLPVVPMFLILLPVVLIDLATTSTMLTTFSSNQPRLMSAGEWLRALTVAVAATLLIGPLGGIGAAIARLLSRVVGAVYTAWVVQHRIATGVTIDGVSPDGLATADSGPAGMA